MIKLPDLKLGALLGPIKSIFQTKKGKHSFITVTPKADVDLQQYEKELSHAFNDKNARSIAFFGPSGSGKSSVIETYEKKNGGTKFLHINLSRDKAQSDIERDSPAVKDFMVEGIILNELLESINPKRIPQTKFIVKKEQATYGGIITMVLAMFLLITLTYTIFFPGWQNYVNSLSANWIAPVLPFLLFTASAEARLIGAIVCSAVLAVAIYCLVTNFQYHYRVKSVKLSGTEIQLFKESESPYLNRYWHDVIYLFERADAHVIVFDDIDGYITNKIFSDLCRINKHINDRRATPLRFLYLLADDIFDPVERTRFFNYSFSIAGFDIYDRFAGFLNEAGIYDSLAGEEEFLKKVATYINDMRRLQYVCNEFTSCINRIKPAGTKPQLLALIVYKHCFPKDYASLCNNKGFLYSLFSRINDFIKAGLAVADKEINDIKAQIRAAADEVMRSVEELEIVYANKTGQCAEDEIPGLEREMDMRKGYIKDRGTERCAALEKEIISLEDQKAAIRRKTTLGEILTGENIDDIFIMVHSATAAATDFDIRERSQCELLKFLILNKYIDESHKANMMLI